MLSIQRPSSVSRRRSFSVVLLCVLQGVERFGFLAMLPLFVPYANDRHAMAAPTPLLVFGVFQGLPNSGGWPAGSVSDRMLGAQEAALLGAVLLAAGHAGLALDRTALLCPALVVMVAGRNFFTPGLHVLLGIVAATDEHLAASMGYIAAALFGEWAHSRQGCTLLFVGTATAVFVGGSLRWARPAATSAS